MAKRKAIPAASSAKSSGSAGSSGDLERLERILELMDNHEVAELEWEKGGERLHLRTKAAAFSDPSLMAAMMAQTQATAAARPAAPVAHAPAPAAPSAAAPASEAPKASGGLAPNQKQILSPFVGTFYRAPSPTADPYVRDGQSFKRGDVICIIEAMKLMNEIEAEFPGKIISCLAENGQPVEFGEPLFIVEV